MNPYCLDPGQIREQALQVRRRVLEMNNRARQGHTGADLGQADILCSLYFRILDCAPDRVDDPHRDRFIQSKGHGAGGLYCVLAQAGYIPCEELDTYLAFNSRLPGHPVRQKCPGIELNTGALGHGLAVGVGLALAAKMHKSSYKVFVLTGDGELQEGSNWEAALCASRYGLDNLVIINDRNGLQLAGKTESIMPLGNLEEKWRAFGCNVAAVDGNDPAALVSLMEGLDANGGKPHVIIAHTVKGKGVSFIENSPPWHHKVPTDQEKELALSELV